jgi:hypothetical protein
MENKTIHDTLNALKHEFALSNEEMKKILKSYVLMFLGD